MDVTLELWWLSLAIVAAIVVVVALLLGLIIAVAVRIDRDAKAIWDVGKGIAANTVAIWMLRQTNEELAALRERAAERR